MTNSLTAAGAPATVAYPVIFEGRTFTPGGEIPARTIITCDCGHKPAPVRKSSIVPGYTISPDGRTLCYGCAGKLEQAAFARADRYTAYLQPAQHRVVTFTGTALARVTRSSKGRPRRTPTGGWYQMEYIQATGPDGSRWHGTSSSGSQLVNLRRNKVRGGAR